MTLRLLDDKQKAGDIRVCQWCNRAVKSTDTLSLGVGPSGTCYLVCLVCAQGAKPYHKREAAYKALVIADRAAMRARGHRPME